jgi:hypothetical protein
VLTLGLKARALILCLSLLLAGAAASLYAGGQGESRLADVQKLMQQQDYNGALRMLAAIQRTNPNLRDETTRLISEVIIKRGQMYNSVLSQLVKALYEEHDEEKGLQLIPELQRIDPVRALNEAASAFDFVRFFKLMDNAAALIAARKIPEALSLYLLPFTDPKAAGFTMQKPDFDSAGYGNVIETSVQNAVSRIVSVGDQEIKEAPQVAAVPGAVGSLVSGAGTQSALDGFDAAVSPLREAASAEGAIRMIAAALTDMNKSIKETGGKGRDDPYLKYVILICLGREKKTEGIARALQVLWQERAQEAANASEATAAGTFTAARGAYDAQDFKAADTKFDDAYYRSLVALKAIALAGAGLVTTASTGWSVTPGGTEALQTQIAHASAEQEQAAEAQAFRKLIRYRTELGTLPVITANAALDETKVQEETAQLSAARERLAARAVDASADEKEWRARSSALTSMMSSGVQLAPVVRSAGAMADLFAGFIDGDLQPRDLSFALRLAQIRGITYQENLDKAVTLKKQGQDLMNGTKDGKKVEDVVGILKLYPDQAAQRFANGGALVDSLTKDLGDLTQALQEDKPYIAHDPAILALLNGQGGKTGYISLLERARSEQSELNQLLEGAKKQIDDAAVLSRQGDNWFAAAQSLLGRKDPDGASAQLNSAEDAYNKSQGIAYTAYAEQRTDKDIPELRAAILGLRTSIANATAQKWLAEIDKRLNARDYLGAYDALDAAQKDWAQTFPSDPNPSFEIRSINIQNALQISQGRDISRVDPKADVVNTFIKYARDAMASNRLIEAQQNVNFALAVAPNYGAAKVLALQIKKQTNPAAFQKEAAAQIIEYMKLAADTANIQGMKTAYTALLDFARLDPAFEAQTRNTVRELEYNLGLKRRPATAQQIRDSNDLVRQANAAQQQGTPEAYQQALDLLKQALGINPDNRDAITLDGQVRIRIGSTALTALSPVDTQKYKQALNLYLSGDYQTAYDIVQSLWDSPRNRTYGELQRLRKRCEVALNIS